ncbi:MAG: prepilin-type N-terminal cleavage/methylation domain-containing protein [Romboutsia sp.]
MLNKKKNNKGFTLVELLVVIAIIGILAVVAVPALFKNIEKSKVADLEADISAIRSASLSYYSDNSTYPETHLNSDGTETPKILIKSELEGLSFPFNGEYIIKTATQEDIKVEYKDRVKVGDLILKTSGGKSISESGLSKLNKDLGNKMATLDSSSTNSIIIVLISK